MNDITITDGMNLGDFNKELQANILTEYILNEDPLKYSSKVKTNKGINPTLFGANTKYASIVNALNALYTNVDATNNQGSLVLAKLDTINNNIGDTTVITSKLALDNTATIADIANKLYEIIQTKGDAGESTGVTPDLSNYVTKEEFDALDQRTSIDPDLAAQLQFKVEGNSGKIGDALASILIHFEEVEDNLDRATDTIYQLQDTITGLQNTINNLQDRIEQLEAPTENPGYLTESEIREMLNEKFEALGHVGPSFTIVTELPTENIDTSTIYLVRNAKEDGDNLYVEYYYMNGKWEELGSFSPSITGEGDLDDLEEEVIEAYIEEEDSDADEEIIEAHIEDDEE